MPDKIGSFSSGAITYIMMKNGTKTNFSLTKKNKNMDKTRTSAHYASLVLAPAGWLGIIALKKKKKVF